VFFNQAASVKFGLYVLLIFIVLVTLAGAQEIDQNSSVPDLSVSTESNNPVNGSETDQTNDPNALSQDENGSVDLNFGGGEDTDLLPDLNVGEDANGFLDLNVSGGDTNELLDLNVGEEDGNDLDGNDFFDLNEAGGDVNEPIDLNIDTQFEPLTIRIFSPLFGDQISGSGVVLVGFDPLEGITNAFFEIGEIHENLFIENNFSSSFDSTLLEDGEYTFSVQACIQESCSTQTVQVIIKNSVGEEIIEDPIIEEPKLNVKGTNLFSPLTLFELNGEIVGSGTDFFEIVPGTYNARIDFIDSVFSQLQMSEVVLNSNVTLIEVDTEIDSNFFEPPDKNKNWISIYAIKPNVLFYTGDLTLNTPTNGTSLFECISWDFEQRTCNGEWVKSLDLVGEPTITIKLNQSAAAYGFLEIKPFLEQVNDATEVLVKSKKVLMKLKGLKFEFGAKEKPEFEIFLEDLNGLSVDGIIEAFLYGPKGIKKLRPDLIQNIGKGKFKVKLEKKKAFKPGIYKLLVRIIREGETIEEELWFQWGLVSLNTRKSIYKPGELAEFIIVVLNKDGSPVCDASILLVVKDPNGSTTNFSTALNTITPNEDCGLYAAVYPTQIEGTHNITINAKAEGVESNFETNFLVQQFFDFDILRTAESKIDPTIKNKFDVRIDITSFTGENSIEITEFVPKEFTINADSSIQEVGDAKILAWSKDLVGGKTFVEYSYSVPLIWPYLYELGEAEIFYNNQVFTEARPWYVAVDPDAAKDVNQLVATCTGASTINSCPDLNVLATAQDIISVKNNTLNAGMADANYNDTINSVIFHINHDGEAGIDGEVAVTLQNAAGTIEYCAKDISILNVSGGFVHDTLTACTPAGGWNKARLDDLNVLVRNEDNGGGNDAYYDYIQIVVNYTPGDTVPFIDIPPTDANTDIEVNQEFLVEGNTLCTDNNCYQTSTFLQYCVGAGCTNFFDMNTDSGQELFIQSGTNPQNSASLLVGTTYNVTWNVQGTTESTFELRLRTSSATADANNTDGTLRTITLQAASGVDLSFAVLLPSTGCTQGEGSIDAGSDCERGWFATTDLTGNADENKVFAQGQQYGADGNTHFFCL